MASEQAHVAIKVLTELLEYPMPGLNDPDPRCAQTAKRDADALCLAIIVLRGLKEGEPFPLYQQAAKPA